MRTIFNVLPARWRQKPTGIDKKRNYVTVTICIRRILSVPVRKIAYRFVSYLLPCCRFVDVSASCYLLNESLSARQAWRRTCVGLGWHHCSAGACGGLGAWPPPVKKIGSPWVHGRMNRSGRPGSCRTNNLTNTVVKNSFSGKLVHFDASRCQILSFKIMHQIRFPLGLRSRPR